jgi:P2 family phage contractile tail tube protein
MGFPSKLKNMNLFLDGTGYLGTVEEVTVPKLTLKMDEWRGGGMLGPVMADMGLDKLEAEFTMGGLIAGALRQFGATALDAALLRFAGAYQDDSTGAVQAVEVVLLGRYSEIDMGNAKPGDNTQHKYKLACTYYKLTVDGLDWLEIDMLGGLFIVFGVDRYADIRDAIGD